jgi:hypothetical protein
MYRGRGCKAPFKVNLSLMEMRSQLHTLVILIHRKNRDGRLGAPQDPADCIDGGKKIFSLMEIEL